MRGLQWLVMEKVDIAPHRQPGEILCDLRKVLAPEGAQKLTQGELAKRLRYNKEYVQAMESGRKPIQTHFVEELARLDDDARFPDAFARLIEELRGSVAAYWAARAARPPDIGAPLSDRPALTGSVVESVASKLEEKLDTLRGTMDGLSARAEGRLDGLGGKLDRTEGTLSVLGNKLETTSAKTEATLGTLGGRVDHASARTEEALGVLGGKVDIASTRTEEALGGLCDKVDTASARTEEALSALGGGVDTASARTEKALSALGGKVDTVSARAEEALGALGDKVEAASARTNGQLSEVAANVADAGNKLDRTDAKVESVRTQATQAEKKVTRKLDMAMRVVWANFGLGIVCAAAFVLHCHRAPGVLQPAQGGTAKSGVAQGAVEAGAQPGEAGDPARRFPGLVDDASGELGKKAPAEKWIPPEPFPEQARGPCKASLGEIAINGGCWVRIDYVKPPCGDLFRNGDSCYRPILEAPKQPLGQ